MDSIGNRAGPLNSNVEVGKYTVLILKNTNSIGVDAVDVPSGANVGPFAGVAMESILPDGFNDYVAGVYQIASGTAWPANVIPSSSQGRNIGYVTDGVTRVIAGSGTINTGDRLNVADSQGRVKTINETSGTTVYEVGEALEPSTQAGTVITMRITNVVRTV
jgi:hypothetical protein